MQINRRPPTTVKKLCWSWCLNLWSSTLNLLSSPPFHAFFGKFVEILSAKKRWSCFMSLSKAANKVQGMSQKSQPKQNIKEPLPRKSTSWIVLMTLWYMHEICTREHSRMTPIIPTTRLLLSPLRICMWKQNLTFVQKFLLNNIMCVENIWKCLTSTNKQYFAQQ